MMTLKTSTRYRKDLASLRMTTMCEKKQEKHLQKVDKSLGQMMKRSDVV